MKISVVIPAYNVEPWIDRAIASVASQDDPADEIVVVNDGSVDRTGELAAAHPGVRVYDQPNGGLASARNAGARLSTGDAVFFLDADDELMPHALRCLRAAGRAVHGWSAMIPNCARVGPGGANLAWAAAGDLRILTRADARRLIARNRLSPHALIRRSVWEAFPYREELRSSEDLELWLRLLLAGERVVLLGEPLVRVREGRPGSLSSNVGAMRRSRKRVFSTLWGRNDLTMGERATLGYQLARTTVGTALAPSVPRTRDRPSESAPPPRRAVHVALRDGGGGPAHVELLREGLGVDVPTGVCWLDPGELSRAAGTARGALAVLRATPRGGIVHAHGLRAAAIALPGVLIRRARLVVTVHGLHVVRRDDGWPTRTIARAVLREADRVLVLSRSDMRALVEGRFARPDRVALIHAAVAAPERVDRSMARRRYGVTEGEALVVWVGRLSPEKDPGTFLRAFRNVGPPVVGVVAGDGPSSPEVERLAGQAPRVRLVGWIDDIPSLLAASDVFVNTSRWEGLSIAALQAARTGVPLIMTDVDGNRDLVESGVPVVLVPPGDPRGLAVAIEMLANDSDRRASMGERAAEVVRRDFTPERLARDVLDVYRSLA